jgi:anhydro-N-acetylmuramic acid kinase
MALNTSGPDELHRAPGSPATPDARLCRRRARPALAGQLPASAVQAIGAHGQTVRHRPQQFDGTGYTMQLAQAGLAGRAERHRRGGDFRSRDVAAGGQGAPLAPFFHQEVFGRPAAASAC